jgi:hypothetical protein
LLRESRLTKVASPNILRSLTTDNNGILYTGAKGEFGYFKPNLQCKLTYISLAEQLPETEKNFGNIWKVFAMGEAVYFCAFEGIFKYKNFQLQKVIKPKQKFFVAFCLDNKIYLSEDNRGILTVENDTIRVGCSESQKNPLIFVLLKHQHKRK